MTTEDRDRIRAYDEARRARWYESYGHDRMKTVRRTFRYLWIETEGDEVEVQLIACRITPRTDEWQMKLIAWNRPTSPVIHVRDFDYHGVAGWIVKWSGEPRIYDSGYYSRIGDWTSMWEFHTGLSFPWDEVINPEALAETKYAHCGWAPRCPVGLIDYLHLYEREPRIEYLAKAELWSLVSPAGLNRLEKNREFMPWCRQHINEIRTGSRSVREIIYAQKHGISIADAVSHFAALQVFSVHRLPKPLLPQAAKIRLYLHNKNIYIPEYSRYICYAETAGWDLGNESIVYPPPRGFKARLEQAEEAAHAVELAKERRQKMKLSKDIRNVAKRFALAVRHRTLSVVLPESVTDLKHEGKAMSNCIGQMGYDAKIANGISLIFFIRKAGKPYADCEITLQPKPAIRQLYAKNNSKPTKATEAFANEILRHVRRIVRVKKAG